MVAARAVAAQRVITGSYSQAAVAEVVQRLLRGGQRQVGENGDADAARAEPGLDADEALLRNLYVSDAVCFCIYMPAIDRSLPDCRYDAAAGRLPSWLERVWANQVGWQARWKEFFCVVRSFPVVLCRFYRLVLFLCAKNDRSASCATRRGNGTLLFWAPSQHADESLSCWCRIWGMRCGRAGRRGTC